MKIEIGKEGKFHAQIIADGSEFCTLYGTDWKKNYLEIKTALELLALVRSGSWTKKSITDFLSNKPQNKKV